MKKAYSDGLEFPESYSLLVRHLWVSFAQEMDGENESLFMSLERCSPCYEHGLLAEIVFLFISRFDNDIMMTIMVIWVWQQPKETEAFISYFDHVSTVHIPCLFYTINTLLATY